MWRLALAFGLLGSGCRAVHPADRPVAVEVAEGSPAWLVDSAREALAFWWPRGGRFAEGSGGIRIGVGSVPGHEDGNRAAYRYREGDVVVAADADALNGRIRDCMLVHELGHAIGMDHVSVGGDLMSEIGTLNWWDGDCPWTARDREEYRRATGIEPRM